MDEIRRLFIDFGRRLENLEKGLVIKIITIPTDGRFVPKKLAVDPVTPVDGEMWINTTGTNHLKIYLNGSVTTIV